MQIIFLSSSPLEIMSGETSSISRSVVGFDKHNKLVSHTNARQFPMDDIAKKSTHMISFIDTCGKSKYRRTTIQAVVG